MPRPINPLIPAEFVIDHSVIAESSAARSTSLAVLGRGQSPQSLGLTGEETYTITGLAGVDQLLNADEPTTNPKKKVV